MGGGDLVSNVSQLIIHQLPLIFPAESEEIMASAHDEKPGARLEGGGASEDGGAQAAGSAQGDQRGAGQRGTEAVGRKFRSAEQ